MRRAWPLLALAALSCGGCGQKGPLYLPDKGGKVVTSAPPAPQSATAPVAPVTSPPANSPPAEPAPAAPAPKPTDKDQDQGSPPPK